MLNLTRGMCRCRSVHHFLFGFTILLLPYACAPSNTTTTSVSVELDTVEVREIIDSMRAMYEGGVATGDMAALGAVVAQDFIGAGPGGAAWDSLRAASDAGWPRGTTLDITPMEVRVLNDEWAYELGTSVATWTPPGSSETRTLRDTYLVLFRRTPEGWKLYREVASPDLPQEN